MYALDLAAAVFLATGAFLGARKGLWRMLAGGIAVSLGTLAGAAASPVLAAALAEFGLVYPGDVVLGFFLPFALVSVYTRYMIGLWLSNRLERRPRRNRALGAAAGVIWAAFALGLLARLAGLDPAPPFCRWLARYPGAVASRLGPQRIAARGDGRIWEEALKVALDGRRVQARAAEADRKASDSVGETAHRQQGESEPVRLRTP